MAQTLGAVRVTVNNSFTKGVVRVTVNNSSTKRVQSVNYLPSRTDLTLKQMTDITIEDNASQRAVLTYDPTTEKFVAQDVPRLEGGTF
jgi:hypothetical protein